MAKLFEKVTYVCFFQSESYIPLDQTMVFIRFVMKLTHCMGLQTMVHQDLKKAAM